MSAESPSSDRVPRAHSRGLQALGRAILKSRGFRLHCESLPNEPRFVLLLAPHTSNWDFVLALAAVLAMDVKANWFAKHSIFKPPLGAMFRAIGGIALNRGSPRQAMEQITEAFRSHDELVFAIAPEGTRKRIARWKRGFYQIAVAANVPIVCGFVDYGTRTAGTGPTIYPTGDYETDIEKIQSFYRTIKPKFPDQFAAEG